MGALLPLFDQPLPHAVLARELAAAGADDSVLNLAKADEALEEVVDVVGLSHLSLPPPASAFLNPPLVRALDSAGVVVGPPLPSRVDHIEAVVHRDHVIVLVHVGVVRRVGQVTR